MDEVHVRAARVARRWNVEIGSRIETGSSLIAFGHRGAEQVVLKVVKRPGDEWRSGEVVNAFGGRGVVRALGYDDGAVLLERIVPGTALVEVIRPLLNEAVDLDNYKAAHQLGDAIIAAAKKAKSASLVFELQKRMDEIAGIEKNFAKLQGYLDRVRKDPKDATANLELGKYFGFQKRRWEKALPYFAAGSDEKLKKLAQDDMKNPAVVGIDDLQHARARQRSRVERLSARGWIEGGALEHQRGFSLVRRVLDDLGVEFHRIGIVVIQALGHLPILSPGLVAHPAASAAIGAGPR